MIVYQTRTIKCKPVGTVLIYLQLQLVQTHRQFHLLVQSGELKLPVSQENDSLRSFILQLEQKINDQERTINLMKLAKQETHSTNDHSPPKIRHSLQAHDASMHNLIIDNNGLSFEN